jgi:hypothetical protein
VKREARVAAKRNVLITARIEPVVIEDHSTEFAGRHLTDLESFSGDVLHPGFLELMRAVAEQLTLSSLHKVLGGVPVVPASIPKLSSPATTRWEAIAGSLDVRDDDDFTAVFPSAPEAFEARRNRRQLVDWLAIDQKKESAVAEFLAAGPFPALAAICDRILSDFQRRREEAEAYRAEWEAERRREERRLNKIRKVAKLKADADPSYVSNAVRQHLAGNPGRPFQLLGNADVKSAFSREFGISESNLSGLFASFALVDKDDFEVRLIDAISAHLAQ